MYKRDPLMIWWFKKFQHNFYYSSDDNYFNSNASWFIFKREKWTKIVVLKLFIQNLCIDTSRREELKAQSCMILWMVNSLIWPFQYCLILTTACILSNHNKHSYFKIIEEMESCNFKEKTTLDEIERFLQASNKKVLKEYLGWVN